MERADFKYYEHGCLVYVTPSGVKYVLPAGDDKLYRVEDVSHLRRLLDELRKKEGANG